MGDSKLGLQPSAVLIVDDTPANIDVLRKILQADGHKIFAATSGELALKVAEQVQPDLVLLDVMMPGIDGFQTCRLLKGNDATREIPVVFVTAKTEVDDIIEGFKAGGVDYISKPIREEEVRARVRTQLQVRQYVLSLREQAERFRSIVTNIAEGMLMIEANGRIRFANPAAGNLLGYFGDGLVGQSLLDLLIEPYCQVYRRFFLSDPRSERDVAALPHGPREVRMRHSNDQELNLDLTITPMYVPEGLYIGLLHDISAHKRSQDELWQIANTDQLTNLANRRLFDSRLEQEWLRSLRAGTPLALAILDIDYFKAYNDSLGHQAGDSCLQRVAQVIRTVAQRRTDLVARFGGDEFVALFYDTDADAAQPLLEAVCSQVAALGLPHPNASTGPVVTVSVGAAVWHPQPGESAGSLFALADEALYRAKRKGRNRVEVAQG